MLVAAKQGHNQTPQIPTPVAAKQGHNLVPQTHSLAYKKGLNRAP